jgi:DNA-binding NtrC family response regulator
MRTGMGAIMKEKILFVDDEPNLLRGIKLVLRKKFIVDIAEGPLNGLKKFKNDGPYAVVISDLKMPGADGIDFLEQVRKISDETVRMLLTGYGDLDSAIEAVNRGQIFRFMNKPCPKETLIANLEAGVAQYRLIRAEKEVLKGTLREPSVCCPTFFPW